MNEDIVNWLLKSNPWTEYRTRIDLLDQSPDCEAAVASYDRMVGDPGITSVLDELKQWPGAVVNNHKNAGLLYHKLAFIADIGLKNTHPVVSQVIEKIFGHISEEGIILSIMNIPVHFGGTGQDKYAWALCDAPLLTYAIAKSGMHAAPEVLASKKELLSLCRDNGYPCVASKQLGRFRGPGRKEDPCPYATLLMLKLMSLFPEEKNSEQAVNSIASILNLWENSKNSHPYLFNMGTDFRKLKAPLIWYDIVHVTDVLSNFSLALKDQRFHEMMDIIDSKATKDGIYIPESEWQAWKGWDFGQKKQPSAWLTFLIYRIKKRISVKVS